MIIKDNIIQANVGFLLRRKSDGYIAGEAVYLGYTYHIGNNYLAIPHLEIPEDYEEITKEEVEQQNLEEYGQVSE